MQRIEIWTRITDLGDGSSSSQVYASEAQAREGMDDDGFVEGNDIPCEVNSSYLYIPLPTTALNFSQALTAVKKGKRVARSGWNGKSMFIFLVNGSTFEVNREPLLSILGKGTFVDYHAHIDMRTADGTIVPWLASQTDLLASDWEII